MNKKGIFFTVLAISLLSLFLISYSIYSVVENREPVNKRIKSMNNFVLLVEKDLPRKLYISGFRIIFLFEKRIAETGEYITGDINSVFEEAFFNGTILGENNEEIQQIMEDATFSGIQNSLNEIASKINVVINLSNPEISISQDDPWNIKLTFNADLLIEDIEGLAFWNREYIQEVYIPIEEFEDPLYLIETNGLITNEINRTEDTSDLLNHVQNSYYINSTSAPSFLDRLQGKTTSNENGIESLVYLPKLVNQGISLKQKSVVDYIYFDDSNPGVGCQVSEMPDWFRLDNVHLIIYDVQCI